MSFLQRNALLSTQLTSAYSGHKIHQWPLISKCGSEFLPRKKKEKRKDFSPIRTNQIQSLNFYQKKTPYIFHIIRLEIDSTFLLKIYKIYVELINSY